MPHLFYCLNLQPYTWTHLHRDPGPISSVLLACLGRNIHESMEYFYAAEKELQRQRERIRQLENILTENGIPVPEES